MSEPPDTIQRRLAERERTAINTGKAAPNEKVAADVRAA
jgi:hypothetical protein